MKVIYVYNDDVSYAYQVINANLVRDYYIEERSGCDPETTIYSLKAYYDSDADNTTICESTSLCRAERELKFLADYLSSDAIKRPYRVNFNLDYTGENNG